MTTKLNGTVKWFNSTKGYGFIKPDDSNTDVYCGSIAPVISGKTVSVNHSFTISRNFSSGDVVRLKFLNKTNRIYDNRECEFNEGVDVIRFSIIKLK